MNKWKNIIVLLDFWCYFEAYDRKMLIFSSSLTPGLVKGSNDTRCHPPNVLEFLFEFFVVQCILVKSGAVHAG